jgi:hypothetical protein
MAVVITQIQSINGDWSDGEHRHEFTDSAEACRFVSALTLLPVEQVARSVRNSGGFSGGSNTMWISLRRV